MEGASEVGRRKWRCSREDLARLGCRDGPERCECSSGGPEREGW